MKRKYNLLFIFILLITFPVSAQLSLGGYIKDMQTTSFFHPDSAWQNGNLIHNRLNFKYNIDTNWTAALEIRNRLYWGDNPSANLSDQDAGLVKASYLIWDNPSAALLTQADRFWVSWTNDKWSVTMGRQRINWGQTFVWNPNDIFNTWSFFDFDYEERPGSDAIRIQHFTGPSSRWELAAQADSGKDITLAGLYARTIKNYDVQFFGGVYKSSDFTLGTGFSGSLGKGMLRGELSLFSDIEKVGDTSVVVMASLGYDFMFENSLTLQGEILFNGNKKASADVPLQMLTQAPSAKNIFLPGISLFAMASYPFTPLFNGSLSIISVPQYKILFAGPTAGFSVSQNSEIGISAYYFSELAKFNGFNHLTMFFLRYRYSF
ncbi:MAG: hypothetical protein CVU05_04630 [Bacteroidetes bacterium HGW-Bacteroidetes-21]|nr:MAG: hypothetical protein CVU05_04630 [Bacteroidetes bacterium HGW-Bacteroidetes-21]